MNKCRFCTTGEAVTTFAVDGFEWATQMSLPDPLGQKATLPVTMPVDGGDWPACSECAELIANVDLVGLADRCYNNMKADKGKVNITRQSIEMLFQQFFVNRIQN